MAPQRNPDATEQGLVNSIQALKTWKRQEQKAAHKPLLLLLFLGRIQRNESRLAPFLEVEPMLIQLLRTHSSARGPFNAGYPFWRLQHDGIWEVIVQTSAELVFRKSNTDPTLTSLRRSNAQGGFFEKYDRLLRDHSELRSRIARILLAEHFSIESHESICTQVGLIID